MSGSPSLNPFKAIATSSKVLFTQKKDRSVIGRYIEYNGYLYTLLGLMASFTPVIFLRVQKMLGTVLTFGLISNAIEETECLISSTCLIGLCLLVIGYFYVIVGKTEPETGLMATVFDRLTFVPILLIWSWWKGFPWEVCVNFFFLDPALGLGGWYIIQKHGFGAKRFPDGGAKRD